MRINLVKWNWRKPENIYFLIALFLGLLFALITPPFQVPDESTHFFRANQIAEGKVFGVEGEIISSIHAFNSEFRKIDLQFKPYRKIDPVILIDGFFMPLNKEEKINISTPTTINYHSIMYLPQTLGVLAGKALNFSPYKLLLTSRIVNLIFGILLTTLAIKICPFRKWSLLYISLLPMTLFLYGSASPDTFTISVCIFYTSFVMYLKTQGASRNNIVLIILLTFLLAFLKPGYVFLCLIIFLVPIFPKNKSYDTTAKLAIIFATFALFLVWYKVSGNFEPEPFLANGGVDSARQLEYVLMNPFRFIRIFLYDLVADSAGSVLMFIGVLGWVDTVLPIGVYVIYELCLGFILIFDNDYPIKSIKNSRLILMGTFLITFTILYAVFYFIYTPVGADRIQGFQGRYILPIASLVFISFLNIRKKFYFNKIYLFVPFWVIGGVISILTVISRYYG
ncbi:MAG: DUF2142 domain-containing protein [Bellilinea sp.]